MKIFIDTNVAIAAIIESHPHHSLAIPLLRSVISKSEEGAISQHTLLEVYAVLTNPRIHFRIDPWSARQLIDHNLVGHFEVISVNAKNYLELLRRLGEGNLCGAAVYDALILEAAWVSEAERIYTFNVSDFKKVARLEQLHLISAP